jgi:hypothetical protein
MSMDTATCAIESDEPLDNRASSACRCLVSLSPRTLSMHKNQRH